MRFRTVVMAWVLGTATPGIALANEIGVCKEYCGGGDDTVVENPSNNSDDGDDYAPEAPSESAAERRERLANSAEDAWARERPGMRARWQAERAPLENLTKRSEAIRSRAAEVVIPDRNSRVFRTTSGVGGALKGRARDEDPRRLDTQWSRLDCAAKLAAGVAESLHESPDEALYLAGEAQSALSGATNGVACAPGSPPEGYGALASGRPEDLKKRMARVAGGVGAYKQARENEATLATVAADHKAAAAQAAKEAAALKARAQEAMRAGDQGEAARLQQMAEEQREFQKRDEERIKKIFALQKQNEKEKSGALAELKAGNASPGKGGRP